MIEWRKTDARQCGKPVYHLSWCGEDVARLAWNSSSAGAPRGGGRWEIVPDEGTGVRGYMAARTLDVARSLAESIIPMDCEDAWGHHSDDRVIVYHGRPTPWMKCGRHAYE